MSDVPDTRYALAVDVAVPHDAAVERVTAFLADEGFGVLTTIDAQATLKKKIGADIPPYTILGACSPPLAHRAITHEEAIGVLLPCNVVVKELDAGSSRVFLTRASALFTLVDRADIADLAADVDARMERVASRLRDLPA